MNDVQKVFLIKCIRREIKKRNIMYKDMIENITDKYTISKLFNHHMWDEDLFHKILHRLDLYYDENADLIYCSVLASSLLLHLENNDVLKINTILQQYETLILKHSNHIFFIELNYYISILKDHFIHNKTLSCSLEDISSLTYFSMPFQTAIIHTICENALFHANINAIKSFINNIRLTKPNCMTNYFDMLLLQSEKKNIEANNIYRNYEHQFIENNDHYNLFRFYLLQLQKDIRKHPASCIARLNKLETKIDILQFHSKYNALIYFTYMILYIRENKYEVAYAYANKGMQEYPHAHDLFIPYYILLSIYLNKNINTSLFDTNAFNHACITLYTLYESNNKKASLKFIINKFPKPVCENPCYETLIHILNKIVIKTAKTTQSYKCVMKFHNEYQKYNKNYYL